MKNPMPSALRHHAGLALVLLVAVTGCASTLRGTKQELEITSDPSGVQVLVLPLNQRLVTPATIEVSRLSTVTILVERAGFTSVIGYAEPEVDWNGGLALMGNFLFVVIPGIPGLMLDQANGAAYSLTPNPVHLDLTACPCPKDVGSTD
jgi:hypothetical protein